MEAPHGNRPGAVNMRDVRDLCVFMQFSVLGEVKLKKGRKKNVGAP